MVKEKKEWRNRNADDIKTMPKKKYKEQLWNRLRMTQVSRKQGRNSSVRGKRILRGNGKGSDTGD